ncbi:Oidioi.mRNA.OKI2018_I69.chr1.g1641.t1.cds [Oikopleura dioica]|uniref:Oidioi.mRNA.OKI2018_I69.chr1.g1641.t1.cds n=1 Tax=Oikopleura dioica TaxID=34765 RepID=A0ABN7STL2_OIKDI|nr:Oidioi.mRNA.OKI2018_I69.chr1.g1641.t1.cds [Oikopleura dioica]
MADNEIKDNFYDDHDDPYDGYPESESDNYSDSVDGHDDTSEIIDLLGLQLNESNQNAVFGATVVPEKQDENEDTELDVNAVVDLLKLREEALEAGRQACLKETNMYRWRHKRTARLNIISSSSNEIAQAWAEELASGAEFRKQIHKRKFYDDGQNIYRGSIEGSVSNTGSKELYEKIAKEAVKTWYSQIDNYDFETQDKKDPNGGEVDSFCQTVWGECRFFGAGIALSDDLKTAYVVCRYFPGKPVHTPYNRYRNVNVLKGMKDPTPVAKPVEPVVQIDPYKEAQTAAREECLAAHNEYRGKHITVGGSNMYLFGPQTNKAQKVADKLASGRSLLKRERTGHSIYEASVDGSESVSTKEILQEIAKNAVTDWYSQIDNYDFETNGKKDENGGEVDYFTRLVWKSNKWIGVGVAMTEDRKSAYIVCNYRAQKGLPTEEHENVLPVQ